MSDAGRIVSIWRYPVKSMAGERLESAMIGAAGLLGDRTWAVRDVELGTTTSAKRLPGLMWCTARYVEPPGPDAGPGNAPEVVIGFPDGREVSSGDPGVHQTLSAYLDREVELRPLPPVSDRAQYRNRAATQADLRTIFGLGPDEPLPDLSMFPVRKLAEITRFATPVGSYVDAYPVHLLTEQSLRAMAALTPKSDFDVRRFRPTVLIDSPGEIGTTPGEGSQPELGWCGGALHTPGVMLSPVIPTIRCVMPSHSQPGLERDAAITRTVAAHARRCLGVYATVTGPGRIAAGDPVQVDRPERSTVTAAAGTAATRVKRVLMRAMSAALPRGD